MDDQKALDLYAIDMARVDFVVQLEDALAENKKLREALEPWAKCDGHPHQCEPECGGVSCYNRTAIEALAPAGEQPQPLEIWETENGSCRTEIFGWQKWPGRDDKQARCIQTMRDFGVLKGLVWYSEITERAHRIDLAALGTMT